jgi:hypothetical protein
MPKSHQTDIAAGIDGNVFAGRATQTIQFRDNRAVSSGVRGKSIQLDSSLKAYSDVIAMKEVVGGGTRDTAYGYQGRLDGGVLNKNTGRYQIMLGRADEQEVYERIIQGSPAGDRRDREDRAFVGRLFYGTLDRGGNEYLKFTQGGYKFDDFKNLIVKSSNEWQSLRGNWRTNDGRVDNHLTRYYGSDERGLKFLYQYYMYRKQMYDQQAGAPVKPTAELGKPNPPQQSKFTPAEANKVANPRPSQPPKPKQQTKAAAPVPKQVDIALGKKVSNRPTTKADPQQTQAQTRPYHQRINLSIDEGQLVAEFIQESTEATLNSRANRPAGYRSMGGRAAQVV